MGNDLADLYQHRVNTAGELSGCMGQNDAGGPNWSAEEIAKRFEAKVVAGDAGYVAEYKINLVSKAKAGDLIGISMQINDVYEKGASASVPPKSDIIFNPANEAGANSWDCDCYSTISLSDTAASGDSGNTDNTGNTGNDNKPSKPTEGGSSDIAMAAAVAFVLFGSASVMLLKAKKAR